MACVLFSLELSNHFSLLCVGGEWKERWGREWVRIADSEGFVPKVQKHMRRVSKWKDIAEMAKGMACLSIGEAAQTLVDVQLLVTLLSDLCCFFPVRVQ